MGEASAHAPRAAHRADRFRSLGDGAGDGSSELRTHKGAKYEDWDFGGIAVATSALVRCGAIEVRTDWWFGSTYSGKNNNDIASFASWWREPGDGLDASTGWRSVTAYKVLSENSGPFPPRFYGATGAPTSGNAGVRAWADRVGLGSMTTTEVKNLYKLNPVDS